MRIQSFLFLSSLVLCVTGCSKANTKEFFFGSPNGPDPFVIGSTLSPLKMISNLSNTKLPEPKPMLPLSQMPSHAKKASTILDIKSQKSTSTDINSNIIGSVTADNQKTINFQEFDTQMQQQYAIQEDNDYVLSNILGKKETIDPTVREKILEKQN